MNTVLFGHDLVFTSCFDLNQVPLFFNVLFRFLRWTVKSQRSMNESRVVYCEQLQALKGERIEEESRALSVELKIIYLFILYTQQFFARIFVLFVKTQTLIVTKTPPSMLPLCTYEQSVSVTSRTRPARVSKLSTQYVSRQPILCFVSVVLYVHRNHQAC